MDKRIRRYFVLILSVSVLAQKPFAAAASIGTATASPSNWGETKTEERDTIGREITAADVIETDIMETDITEEDAEKGSGNARSDILQVVMPVNTENVFDFIMDPQELIGGTDAAAYSGSRFEENATLFFRRSDERAEADYSSSSDPLTIVNKGNADVKVTLTARISPDSIAGITVSEDPEFQGSEEASLYLALTDGETTVPVDSEGSAIIETVIPGILEGEDPNEYSFQLIGAVNKEGDWSEVTDVSPRIMVTWVVSMDDGAIPGDEEILDEEEILDDEDIPDEDEILAEERLKEEEPEAEKGLSGAGQSSKPEGNHPKGDSGSAGGSTGSAGGNSVENKPDTDGPVATGQEKPEEGSGPVESNPEKNGENSASGVNAGGSGGSASGENTGESGGSASGGNTGESGDNVSGENAGESGDNASGENAGESGGSASEENAGESAGSASGENAGENGDSASGGNIGESGGGASGENAGESGNSASGENAGESGGNASGETAGESGNNASGENTGESGGSASRGNAGDSAGSASGENAGGSLGGNTDENG